MPRLRFCRILILILSLAAILAEGQMKTEVEGQSSINLNNRKDILSVSNSYYRRKLIEDATNGFYYKQ